MTTTMNMTTLQAAKVEKERVSGLIRKLAHKLSNIEPFTDKYTEVYCQYTFLRDYRSELVTTIQLAIREERYGY